MSAARQRQRQVVLRCEGEPMRPAVGGQLTPLDALYSISIVAREVRVECTGPDAELLAVAVETLLVCAPARERSGDLRRSVRREGPTVRVGVGLDYAAFLERRTGYVAKTAACAAQRRPA